MTDEHWPPRLTVRQYRDDPPTRTVWIQVEGFRSMDLGIDKGDPLYVLRIQDLNRICDEITELTHEISALRNKVNEYKEYFEMQKKLQAGSE